MRPPSPRAIAIAVTGLGVFQGTWALVHAVMPFTWLDAGLLPIVVGGFAGALALVVGALTSRRGRPRFWIGPLVGTLPGLLCSFPLYLAEAGCPWNSFSACQRWTPTPGPNQNQVFVVIASSVAGALCGAFSAALVRYEAKLREQSDLEHFSKTLSFAAFWLVAVVLGIAALGRYFATWLGPLSWIALLLALAAAVAQRRLVEMTTLGTAITCFAALTTAAFVRHWTRRSTPPHEAGCRKMRGWAEVVETTSVSDFPPIDYRAPGLELTHLTCAFSSGTPTRLVGITPDGEVVAGKSLFLRVRGGRVEYALAAFELLALGDLRYPGGVIESAADPWTEQIAGREFIRPIREQAGRVEFFVYHGERQTQLSRCSVVIATGDVTCTLVPGKAARPPP